VNPARRPRGRLVPQPEGCPDARSGPRPALSDCTARPCRLSPKAPRWISRWQGARAKRDRLRRAAGRGRV